MAGRVRNLAPTCMCQPGGFVVESELVLIHAGCLDERTLALSPELHPHPQTLTGVRKQKVSMIRTLSDHHAKDESSSKALDCAQKIHLRGTNQGVCRG